VVASVSALVVPVVITPRVVASLVGPIVVSPLGSEVVALVVLVALVALVALVGVAPLSLSVAPGLALHSSATQNSPAPHSASALHGSPSEEGVA
jgi:hypothetical protein